MKTNAEYLKSYSRCPQCDSDQIEGGHIDVEGNTAYQRVFCLEPDCEFIWDDVYKLLRFQEVGE